jgi:hypothetical protein
MLIVIGLSFLVAMLIVGVAGARRTSRRGSGTRSTLGDDPRAGRDDLYVVDGRRLHLLGRLFAFWRTARAEPSAVLGQPTGGVLADPGTPEVPAPAFDVATRGSASAE